MFQQTFKNFNINLTPLNERNSCSGGDLLSGHVSFELSKNISVSFISLLLVGQADVHWSTGGKRKRRYSYKVRYFEVPSLILDEERALGRPTKLQPGHHVFAFHCQIPEGDFPPQFHGLCGDIAYTLTVAIKRPWHVTKEYVTKINFEPRHGQLPPELQAPLQGTNSTTVCSLWCSTFLLELTARTAKQGFVRGETVMITCVVQNKSSHRATLKASLVQRQLYFNSEHVQARKLVHKLDTACCRPDGAPTRPTEELRLQLRVPDSIPLTISNCSLIRVEYQVEVSFGVRGSPDVVVICPVVVHGEPTPHEAPPPVLAPPTLGALPTL